MLTNRDGSKELVSVLTKTFDGNYYCFKFPYVKGDSGREINLKYLRFPSKLGGLYVLVALRISRFFPEWVTV